MDHGICSGKIWLVTYIGLKISKVLQHPKVSGVIRETGMHERDLLRILKVNSVAVAPKVKLHAVNEDAEDNKIVECALAAGADVIVTGDKHLLDLGKFRKTKILPLESFLTASLNLVRDEQELVLLINSKTKKSYAKTLKNNHPLTNID